MLGSTRLIEIIKENRASMLAFVKEDPRAAAVLWGQLIEVERLQESYVSPSHVKIQSAPIESEALQIRKLELSNALAIRTLELQSAETIAITTASVQATAREEEAKARQQEADGKAREEEAKARQQEADSIARTNEADADARKTEALSKAKEAVAKAREAKEHALKAQWDPVARAAEAAERQSELDLRKERLSKGMNENDGSVPAVVAASIAGPVVSNAVSTVRKKRIPKRRSGTKQTETTTKKNKTEDAYIPRKFPPRKYSTTYTRPRRGGDTTNNDDDVNKENKDVSNVATQEQIDHEIV